MLSLTELILGPISSFWSKFWSLGPTGMNFLSLPRHPLSSSAGGTGHVTSVLALGPILWLNCFWTDSHLPLLTESIHTWEVPFCLDTNTLVPGQRLVRETVTQPDSYMQCSNRRACTKSLKLEDEDSPALRVGGWRGLARKSGPWEGLVQKRLPRFCSHSIGPQEREVEKRNPAMFPGRKGNEFSKVFQSLPQVLNRKDQTRRCF